MTKHVMIKYYSDPGHGWGAVKRQLLVDLGIANKISHYSYQKGKTVYLEEDCDLPTLVTTLALTGTVVSYKSRHFVRYSPIRNYACFVTE
jgi:hypothetical protein